MRVNTKIVPNNGLNKEKDTLFLLELKYGITFLILQHENKTLKMEKKRKKNKNKTLKPERIW